MKPTESLNEAWVQATLNGLDDSARDLDAATLSRLNRARQAALAEFNPQQSRQRFWWRSIGGLALASLLAVAVMPTLRQGTSPAVPVTGNAVEASDFELLSSEESIELYENLEFYAWLQAQDSPPG